MLFISHNLAVVRHLSHRVLVLYLGQAVEIAASDTLFGGARHPYTRALLAAIPTGLPGAGVGTGGAADAVSGALQLLPAGGCAFRDRCPYAILKCQTAEPPLAEVSAGHWVACHRSHERLNPLSFHP